jgi:integrase
MASVEKRTVKGRAQYLARWRDDAGNQRSKTFARKIDADRHLIAVQHSLQSGTYVDRDAGKVTFTDFFREWATRQVWESTTVLAMDLAVRTTTFADLPIGSIRRSHVERWVKAMAVDLAPSTIRTRVNNVRAVFRAAVRDRVIPMDPSADVTLPRNRRQGAVIPTPDQVRAVIDSADPDWKLFFALGAFAGLRLGEIAGVQVGDIDFLRRTLHVRRQVQRGGGGDVEIRAPKYNSDRDVYLPDELIAMTARHIEQHCPGDDLHRWLFVGVNGQPPHQVTVGNRWRTTCHRAKITGVTLHGLRHSSRQG